MTLSLTPISHGQLCHGSSWQVVDENQLAERVARIALGQYRHVERILEGVYGTPPKVGLELAASAIKLLTVENDADPWHRDGWIFQAISWLAAHPHPTNTITRPPQIIRAHKGFDGLQLTLAADGKSISAVVIFEDKATSEARKTIREEVWPGIAALEKGERASELTHETTAMLAAQMASHPGLDVDAAISNVLWKDVRRYRVSITVGKTHASDTARAGLFKDFDVHAPGDVVRRQAETLYLPELRKWMEAFAQQAIQHVKKMTNV